MIPQHISVHSYLCRCQVAMANGYGGSEFCSWVWIIAIHSTKNHLIFMLHQNIMRSQARFQLSLSSKKSSNWRSCVNYIFMEFSQIDVGCKIHSFVPTPQHSSLTCWLLPAPPDQLLHLHLLLHVEEVPVHHGDHHEARGVDQQLLPQQLPQGGSPPEAAVFWFCQAQP